MKPFKTTAHINSLDGNKDEITVLSEHLEAPQPYYIVDYKGIKCTAIYNPFTESFYADDIYGLVQNEKN